MMYIRYLIYIRYIRIKYYFYSFYSNDTEVKDLDLRNFIGSDAEPEVVEVEVDSIEINSIEQNVAEEVKVGSEQDIDKLLNDAVSQRLEEVVQQPKVNTFSLTDFMHMHINTDINIILKNLFLLSVIVFIIYYFGGGSGNNPFASNTPVPRPPLSAEQVEIYRQFLTVHRHDTVLTEEDQEFLNEIIRQLS